MATVDTLKVRAYVGMEMMQHALMKRRVIL